MSDLKNDVSRRRFMQLFAATSSGLALPLGGCWSGQTERRTVSGWNQGQLMHLIPLANHEQFLIKTSFLDNLKEEPYLRINAQRVAGRMTDTQGRFWQFYVQDLAPNKTYELQLEDRSGKALCDPWPLKTFPHPQDRPERMRILAFTCAGGNEDVIAEDGTRFFLSLAERHRLLERGLSFKPDAVISNGDHIYWDQKTVRNKPTSFNAPWLKLYQEYGSLDSNQPVLGSSNETTLKRIADPQIAGLYSVHLRSTPAFFLTDDHDLFENDEANDEFITLPPLPHNLAAARATQHLYYPEYLPDFNRPRGIAGCSNKDRIPGLSEVYGTLRYGKLVEALLYDTKRYSTIDGASAMVFPKDTERWLAARTQSQDTDHLLHVPSTPIGWSAGKWGEWYPDVRQQDGTLGKATPKAYWPSGWWDQHQRILEMLTQQESRMPVIASGDLHAFSYGQISRSGELDFANNPIHSVCVGPLGTQGPGFPTKYRGIGATVPTDLTVDELVKPLEKNGFTIIDVTPKSIVFKMYAWLPEDRLESVDQLEPFYSYEISGTA